LQLFPQLPLPSPKQEENEDEPWLEDHKNEDVGDLKFTLKVYSTASVSLQGKKTRFCRLFHNDTFDVTF